MNTKGMSLIEMIVAIMILSIAGFMIVSGFSAVYQFIAKGNDIQYASNTMLSYAEKNNEANVLDYLQVQSSNNTYTISNDKGVKVEVKAGVDTLTPKLNSTISLYVLSNKQQQLIKDTPSFLQMNQKVEALYKLSNDKIKEASESTPYITILSTIWKETYRQNWDSFTNELLPKSLENVGAKPYKIVGYFPWEYVKGKTLEHGEIVLYLSQNFQTEKPTVEKETLHVLYDYIDQRWYYYPGNDYEIAYKGYDAIEPVFLYKGKNQIIKSYSDLRSYIKAKNSGWYTLDSETYFNKMNPDASWKLLS